MLEIEKKYLTFQDFALSNYMYKYSKRNNPNEGFHYNPLPFPAKFRFVEISPMRIFALAKFRGCEFFLRRKFGKMKFRFSGCQISPRWQRNFVWRNFVESKERKTPNLVLHSISFAQYCTRNIFLPLIYRSTCYTLNNVISFEFK